MKNWQLHKLIKNDFDLRGVCTVLRNNAKVLKDIFYALASADDKYPKLGYFGMVNLCKSVSIIEDASKKYPQELISKVDWLLVKHDGIADMLAD